MIDNGMYFYLIGKQTNVDQFTFTMNSIITLKNETLLSFILNNVNDVSKFIEFGIISNIKIIDPRLVLGLFFKDYGDSAAINIANLFVGKNVSISNSNIGILSTMLDEIAITNNFKSQSLTKQISVIGNSKKETELNLFTEKVIKVIDTGMLEIYNSDLNGIYKSSYVFKGIAEPPSVYDRFTDVMTSFVFYYNDKMKDNIIKTDN
jgi:hypothetical protein